MRARIALLALSPDFLFRYDVDAPRRIMELALSRGGIRGFRRSSPLGLVDLASMSRCSHNYCICYSFIVAGELLQDVQGAIQFGRRAITNRLHGEQEPLRY